MNPNVFKTCFLQSQDIFFPLIKIILVPLTINPLKENVENTMSRNRKLMFIQKGILDSFLVVFIAVEIVLLEMV